MARLRSSLDKLLGYLIFLSTATSWCVIIFVWSKSQSSKNIIHDTVKINQENKTRNLLTLFTSFELDDSKPYKILAHKMAIINWAKLKPAIQPVLFYDKESHFLVKLATNASWDGINITSFNKFGTPKLKPMFAEIFRKYNSTFYGYVNGDILFSENLLSTLRGIEKEFSKFDDNVLVIGKRMNLDANLSLPEDTYKGDVDQLAKKAHFFISEAVDYFIFSAGNILNWTSLVDVVIGRPAYDNYLVSMAIKAGVKAIDATRTLTALHLSTPKVRFEGLKKADNNYNKMIIGKKFSYKTGRTISARLYTARDIVSNEIIVVPRS